MNKIQKNIIRQQAAAMRKAAKFIHPPLSKGGVFAVNNRVFCDQFGGRIQTLSDHKAAQLFRLHKHSIFKEYESFPVFPGWSLWYWGNTFEEKVRNAVFFGHAKPDHSEVQSFADVWAGDLPQ